MPIATDILCQVNPGVPTFEQTLRALETIAKEIAPALGWSSSRLAAAAAERAVAAGAAGRPKTEPLLHA